MNRPQFRNSATLLLALTLCTATPALAQPAPAATPAADQPAPAATPAADQPAPAATPAADQPAPAATPAPLVTEESAVSDGYQAANDKNLVATKAPPKRLSFDVMVDMTMPIGKTADYISKVGLQGFSVSFRYYVTHNIGVGVGAAFDGLSQKSEGTVYFKELTITATHTKQLTFTPILAKVFYAFRSESKWEPYFALGLGAAMSSQRLVTGYSAISEGNWHFAAAPEVGTHFDIGKLVVVGAARLSILPASGTAPTHTFGNLSLGVAIQ